MRRFKKSIFSLILAACFVGNISAMATDEIDNSWAKTALQDFISKGWLNGYGDNSYGINENMTRAQYAALINRVADLKDTSEEIGKYSDVEPDAWYRTDLAKALYYGYMNGTSQNQMSPNENITREQAIVMVSRFLKLDTNADITILDKFADKDSISDYAKPYIATMVANGFIKGNNNSISPKSNLTRAEGITVLYNVGDKFKNIDVKEDTKEIKTDLKDGIYTGTGAGYGGTIKLQIKVEKGIITDINIISNSETGAYLNSAKKLIKNVLEKQSTDKVDTISGATKTSRGLLTAINACISQAKGGKDTSTTGATGGGGGGSGQGSSDTGKDIDIKKVIDGTYTGKANGYGGELSVSVSVKDGKITDLKVLSHNESSGYYERGAEVINNILKNQSPNNIDTISGATYTSAGIIRAVKSVLGEEQNQLHTAKMADGTWYGTGNSSLYYENKGPDVVCVVVKDGKISSAYPRHHIEDEGYERGQNILDYVKNFTNITNVENLEMSLNKKEGVAYNAVSGATETARGHLSAVKNAIERAVKFEKDNKNQQIAWFTFAQRPKSDMLFGEKLDLSDTILNIRFNDGSTRHVKFDELSNYDITTSIENNTVIEADNPKLTKYNVLNVGFIQKDSMIYMPSKVVVSQKKVFATPSHLIINFADGKNEKYELNEKDFNYTFEAVGEISNIKLYRNDRELCDAKYYDDYNDWQFDLSKVRTDEGITNWKFNHYYIKIDNSKDDSEIKGFTLDTNYLTDTYGVDYELDLSPLNVNIITEKGSKMRFEGWQDMEKKGFKAEPNNNYKFTKDDAKNGTKQIKITNGQVSQTFDVNIIDYQKQAPAKIQIFKGDEKLTEVEIKAKDWKEKTGFISLYDIKMNKKYENWETDTFNVKVFNSDDELINNDQYEIKKVMSGKSIEIDFINYKEFDEYGAYVKLLFDFSDKI